MSPWCHFTGSAGYVALPYRGWVGGHVAVAGLWKGGGPQRGMIQGEEVHCPGLPVAPAAEVSTG